MADEKPVPVQDAQPIEEPEKKGTSIVQAQATQIVVPRQHAAPLQIPKSYDELLMQEIKRWWDYYEKFGYLYEWSPWERRRFRKLGEALLWYISSMDRDRTVGDAIWNEYKEYRQKHRDEKELIDYMGRRIFYELTLLGKTGQQSTVGVDRVSTAKLAARFDLMFGNATPERPGEVGIRELVSMMQQDVADDYDVLVFICNKEQDRHGGKGSGKSDFAQVLAAMLDPTFDTRTRTVFVDDHLRFGNLMRTTTHEIAWVIDELDKFVNKQETMSAGVRKVASDFIDRRFLNQYVLGCDPQLWYASTKFLNNVTYVIRIVRRGVCEVFLGNERDETQKKILAQQLGGEGHMIELPRMTPPWREVYDRCKQYVKSNGPGALDKMLERYPRWPFASPVKPTAEPVAATVPAPLKALMDESPLLSGPVGSTGAEQDASRSSAP